MAYSQWSNYIKFNIQIVVCQYVLAYLRVDIHVTHLRVIIVTVVCSGEYSLSDLWTSQKKINFDKFDNKIYE